MTAEPKVTVTAEMTVGHVVPGMPAVYGTPMRITHMWMASGSAIASLLPAGYVSVGIMVHVRHLLEGVDEARKQVDVGDNIVRGTPLAKNGRSEALLL